MTDHNAEAALLSCIINEPHIIADIEPQISEDIFTRGEHKILYRDIIKMWQDGKDIDLITLISNSKVDRVKINNISDIVMSATNYKSYVKILKNLSKKRNIHKIVSRMKYEIEDIEDVDNFIAKYQQQFMDLTETKENELYSGQRAIIDYHNQEKNKDGLETELYSLNEYITMHNGNLITIGAFSGVGKTAFANQIGFYNVYKDKSVLFVNLEMEASEIIDREKLRSDSIEKLYDKKFYIYTPAFCYVEDINAVAQQIKYKQGLDLIVVDYIQLVKASNSKANRVQQVAEISRGLKQLARQLHVPVIAMTQLNGDGETREARDIENDSNILMIIDRPDYRKARKPGNDGFNLDINYTVLKINKNRNGKTGQIYLRFDGERQRFTENA